jgi:hypothetical protein
MGTLLGSALLMRHAILALLLALPACKGSRPPYASGWLGDYSRMKPSPRYENQWGWQRPDADFASYDRLVIDDVLVNLIEDSPGRSLDQDLMRRTAADLRDGLVRNIEPYYEIVKTGGAHTMKLQIVLTDVTPAAPGRNAGMAVECEAVDGLTGTRLVTAVSRLEWPYEEGAPALDPRRMEESYAEWARRIVHFLDSSR